MGWLGWVVKSPFDNRKKVRADHVGQIPTNPQVLEGRVMAKGSPVSFIK